MSDAFDMIEDPEIAEALKQRDLSLPVAMLNQLKFRKHALYKKDSGESPCSGAEAYQRYGAAVGPIAEKLGTSVFLVGAIWIIGRLDEWDRSFVVRYPSGHAFVALMMDPDYRRIAYHRAAAVADSRLLMMDFSTTARI